MISSPSKIILRLPACLLQSRCASRGLGFIPFTQTGAQLLFQVCSALYERVAVIITTNLRFAEWSTIMGGDERMSAALLDRLTHKATILEFVGTSYRFRQQLQHQELPVIEAKEPVAAEPVEV